MLTTYWTLFWEFFKTGLFSVGGGMATLPFLQDIGEKTGWYTYGDLMNILAVAQSTPGAIGVNMATYAGFTAAGVPGAVIAVLGEVAPALIVVLTVAMMLKKFRDNLYVNRVFYGLRPASTGLIGAAGIGVVLEVLTTIQTISPGEGEGLLNRFVLGEGGGLFRWPSLLLAALLLILTNWVKPTKKWHPVVFIVFSAVVGVVFGFAGA